MDSMADVHTLDTASTTMQGYTYIHIHMHTMALPHSTLALNQNQTKICSDVVVPLFTAVQFLKHLALRQSHLFPNQLAQTMSDYILCNTLLQFNTPQFSNGPSQIIMVSYDHSSWAIKALLVMGTQTERGSHTDMLTRIWNTETEWTRCVGWSSR